MQWISECFSSSAATICVRPNVVPHADMPRHRHTIAIIHPISHSFHAMHLPSHDCSFTPSPHQHPLRSPTKPVLCFSCRHQSFCFQHAFSLAFHHPHQALRFSSSCPSCPVFLAPRWLWVIDYCCLLSAWHSLPRTCRLCREVERRRPRSRLLRGLRRRQT